MEAAAEGAVGLSEARDGSPLSVAAASDDGDTVVGVSYGIDAADMGTVADIYLFFLLPPPRQSRFLRRCHEQKVPTHLC